MPRVWNNRDPATPTDAIYVGRPTKWGNPFRIGRDGDRDEVLRLHRRLVMARSDPTMLKFRDEVKRELQRKDLVCWCAPLACHADVLLEIANAEEV